MKAAYRTTYGSPEVLWVTEVEIPVPKADEILVKVFAATVNRTDYHVLTGKPWFMHLFLGLLKPKLRITGSDFAGQVESVGKDVKGFKPGDRVMGFLDMGAQSHAQYLTIKETSATFAPANASYEQAAACLEGAFYAISALQPISFRAGQHALVIGASGAIGSSYVQFLKYEGVDVTATCRGINLELVQSLGATQIIDYETEDFLASHTTYDFVFDAVGKYSFGKCKHLLKPKGIYISSHPNPLLALVTPLFGGKREMFTIPLKLMENLARIRERFESGNFMPVIDRQYPLDKIKEAYEYVGSGKKVGNVIISMH